MYFVKALFLSLLLIISVPSLFAWHITIISKENPSERARIQQLSTELGLSFYEDADIILLEFIADWHGTTYSYGGSSKNGTDCSGFVNNLYRDVFEQSLPRSSIDIHRESKKVKQKNLRQGDLVFFKTNGRSRVNHVGVYLWDGYFTHSSTHKGVIISKLDEGYYAGCFVSGGRIR